jgi:CDP-4-dehydro-6-deoxyglucose reductase
MANWLTVWRAAQLVGVSRGALQQRIRAGELLPSDDGRVSTDALLALYPQAQIEELDVIDDVLEVMSAQVTLEPSGHEFTVEGRDTLLQAGLRAGLMLAYGCGNGSCGMCKVRVISGQVAKVGHFDYPLSAVERAQGYTLMCAHTAASSELVLETLEARGPQDIAPQQITASVRAVVAFGADTRLLHLQTPRSHRLRFLAGQAVTLGSAGGGGADLRATYPIASCPCDDRNLHFYVGRESAGTLTQALFAGAVRAGQPVTVLGPQGQFVLADSPRPLVFAACDLGFAPVKSLVEHAIALDSAPALALFWLATRADGHFMANQCRAWSEALDAFEVSLVRNDCVVEGARQLAQAMRADLFDIDCDFYLAGPEAFVATLDTLLAAAGVAARQRSALVL